MSTKGLTPEQVEAAIAATGSKAAAARSLGVARSTLRGFMDRHQIVSRVEQQVSDCSGRDICIEDLVEYGDIAGLLKSRGLDPKDWVVTGGRVNEWSDQRQLRVDIKPRELFPAQPLREPYKRPKRVKSKQVTEGLAFLLPDQHAPHHDKDLLACAVQMAAELRPEQIVFLGDLLDYAAVSRYRKIGGEPGLQETIDAGYEILRSFREASPDSRIYLLEGNHEDRLKNALADKGLISVASLVKANSEYQHPVLSSAHLLCLDELDVEQVFPPEHCSYEHAEHRVFDSLAARHGHRVRSGSGASGIAMIESLRRNIAFGHTHRQSITYVTFFDIDNRAHRLCAIEAGTMATVDSTGLHYTVCPDWQAGFATAQYLGDGVFTPELAVWQDGCLSWRDRIYIPE